jgi:hypothetical protein
VREANWREYYSLRNAIYILRDHGKLLSALRLSVIGAAKPVLNLPVAPRRAWQQLRLRWKAIVDGWLGRMGRRVEPEPWGRRPLKAEKVAADPSGR